MERSHEDSAPKHPATACACRACSPGRFKNKARKYAQPTHACQRCFSGTCEALDSARPRRDGRWVAVQAARPEEFSKNGGKAEDAAE